VLDRRFECRLFGFGIVLLLYSLVFPKEIQCQLPGPLQKWPLPEVRFIPTGAFAVTLQKHTKPPKSVQIAILIVS
jgi:hypothetical protein